MIGLLRVLLAVALGLSGAVLAFFAMAVLTSAVSLLIAGASVAVVVLSAGTTWLSTRRHRRGARVARSGAVAGGTWVLVTLLAVRTAFTPLTVAAQPAPPALLTRQWVLPSGSHIAYAVVPARGPQRGPPLIFLHGGPGGYTDALSLRAFSRLAQDGYRVYFYDQVGGGASSRLADPRQYTVARQVADLEAIRQRIGAPRVVLLGVSWGGLLAAAYLAAHPDRVARLILTSPGPLWAPALHGPLLVPARLAPYGPNPHGVLTPARLIRLAVVRALLRLNSVAARQFASDQEMDHWQDAWWSVAGSQVSCTLPRVHPAVHGWGYYAFEMTDADLARRADPRPALRRLRTPTLIVDGSCNYLRPLVAAQYATTLPDARLVRLGQAGHSAYDDQPALYFAAVRAFLRGQPPPLRPAG